MKKIILACDGTRLSEGSFEFARKLNDLHPILLTGVFLPRLEAVKLWGYSDGINAPFIPLIESNEPEVVHQNIERFEQLCWHNGIDYRVHKDFYDFALPELKKESRYADLLLLSSELFYENIGKSSRNIYLEQALHDVKCPVVLVPEEFIFPEKIILAYDGTDDSVFAIKQFAYLFPELANCQTLLVYGNENPEIDFPDKIQIEELASRHFDNLTLFKLDLDPRKYFRHWLKESKTAMLVSGSFGRSGISQLFKKSFVKEVIADHRIPVFIAHG